MLHLYKLMGRNIAIDAGSGCIHDVDDVAYDALEAMDASGGSADAEALIGALPGKYTGGESVTREDLEELIADIEALRAEGKMFADDGFGELAPPDGEGTPRVVKALCLHVAHTCNLTCDYCFAGQGKYHGAAALMSEETARRAVDFLIESSGSRRNLEVDFFGGEPLLNWDVVKKTVLYAREIEGARGKNFRFTLTTNGVLLDDETTDFCNREISTVVLSLDGRRETHDARRKTPSGGGSYDLIVPKLLRFAARRRGEYCIRGTYTSRNRDFTEDILHIADLGFTELAMEPVVSAPGDALGLTEADLPELFRQYELLAAEMARRIKNGNPFNFYHYTLDTENGPCLRKRIAGCGSGSEYFAVTPDGELYPCHQLAGERDFAAGDIRSGVREDFSFPRAAVNARDGCRACWARLYCSGGCAANAYHSTGELGGVYALGCELFKKRLECAVWLKCVAE
ncbi:MAG: thioether cross-link-forming SCIFF peptide maturase [Oscillospiraceae bacterium]|jgi:uncharacterized protein|nr:thioether cross-link-forming SCIFF peptide maturase [Oscillospiraceae bacterium]